MSHFKAKRHRELSQEIKACKKCPGLNVPRRTMSAPGFGSLDAELFIVGQSLHAYNPDTSEYQIPFLGPKGKSEAEALLIESIRIAGYTFSNSYATNVVHCHTPDGRKSTAEEKATCKKYLTREFEIVQPKIVLALGLDARLHFNLHAMGKYQLSRLFRVKEMVFILAFHPSYILDYKPNASNKYVRSIVTDLKKAKKIVNKG
jgi:uracil-DNA glycosylase family 4